MAGNPLDDLPDVPDVIEEGVTLAKDPKMVIAKKITSAYLQASLAAAVTIPLVASGGAPTISNVPARKPDENLPAQGHGSAEPMRSVMVATTSTMDETVVEMPSWLESTTRPVRLYGSTADIGGINDGQ